MTNSMSVFVMMNILSSSACPFVSFDCPDFEGSHSYRFFSHNDGVITYKLNMKSKAKVNTEPIGVCHG